MGTFWPVTPIQLRRMRLQTGLPVDSFNPMVAGFARRLLGKARTCENPAGCGAGLTHLVINDDGSVHRCMAESFRLGSSLGNITTERLQWILRRVDRRSGCETRADCFDAYAWDQLALTNQQPAITCTPCEMISPW